MRRQELALLAAERRRIGQKRVERTVRRNQIARALLPDAGDPLDVVDGVAHQRKHVDDLLGGDAEFRLDPFRVVPRAFVARVEHADACCVVHKLKEILVAGHDYHGPAFGDRSHRQRADDIIGFEADEREHLHTERFARLMHERDLFREVRRHRCPIGFVVVAQLRSEGRSRQIERRGDALRIVIHDELAQHRHEAIDRVRRAAVRPGQAPYRVVRAIHLVAAVDEIQGGFWQGVRSYLSQYIIWGYGFREARRPCAGRPDDYCVSGARPREAVRIR